uniref:Fibronectin type III domain containing 1 n=1 Tax=Oncorhynchus mykiss TaxID=8022 RepID=A0A8C7RMZ2_ONCMY
PHSHHSSSSFHFIDQPLLLLLLNLPTFSPDKPLRPRNVQLTLVDKGLRVSWEPPNELDGRPVDRYNIGYGKSMRTLRFIKVDKDRRSKVLEDCVNAGLCVWYVPLFVASESIYVVSLQAQRATGRSVPSNRATLTKKTPPEPEEYEAKDIGVRVMSPQSVLISWVDPAIEMEKVLPGGSRHYTVKYREKGESARWEYKETTQRRLLIDTLSADGMYEFSVRISQGDNHGKWSVSVFQRTPESAPSGPPENFDVKPLRGKGTAVTATWDPPEEPNGRIREYIMSYAPAMKPFGMKSVTYRGSTTSAIIDGFLPGDLYIFKIRATNRRGQGPQTKAFSVAMPGGTARGDRREEGEIENRKEEGGRGDRREEGGRGENYYNTPAPPPSKTPAPPASRINPFVKRHQSRFGTGMGSSSRVSSPRADGRVPWSRTASSSSVGAGRPILRGFPSRTAASGAASASGASRTSAVQETSEDAKKPSTLYPLKNGVGAGALKPSLPNRNTVLGESRNPITSSSSSFSSSSSNSSSSSRRNSSEPVHRGSSTREDSSNDHKEDYLYKGSKEMYEWNEKVTDPTTAPKTTATTTTATTTTTSAPTTARRVPQSRAIESVDREATPGRTRPGFIPGSTLPRRTIIGPNGRVRSPLLINRQTGSRFPLRAQPAQSTRLGSSNTNTSSSSSSSSSSSLSQPDHGVSGAASVSTGGSSPSLSRPSHRQTSIGSSQGSQGSSSSSSFSSRDSVVGQGTRTRYPSRSDPHLRSKTPSGGLKPGYGNGHGNGKNGRPNLTATSDKESSTSNDNTKPNGRRYITGPDGAKWVCVSVLDLDKGVLMNEDGRVLQDSQGQPKRVVLGEDGRTIFDHQGSPLVNQEGQALFGHGRESQPVVNPKDKFLTVGGKPIIGLDQAKPRTTTTTRPPTTTTPEPTTLPTTTEMSTEETITMPVFPTCPPGTFLIRDDEGFPMLDADGILDCYPEDELLWQTTLPPTLPPTTTTTDHPTPEPDTRPFNNSPSNEFDLTGKKRFTAPYVNFIQKDPGAPCSLTEALEYLQVDVLENLLKKDSLATNQKQPPKNKPHNITVVAMEGCHSFVILDWAIPLKDDMVSGYMVHSASYDDVLNNRWSSSASSGSHLAVENLKPNSRYYFKVQAKNVFGLGPVSDTITYVTESDDPLLIERPPGGEPIWIPFSFRYNPQHSACKGSQYVKRTWYRKFVGVVLCNSLRYKIFMGDGLKETFYSIADTFGHGEDHCQFVDSYLDGRTGSPNLSMHLPTAQGYYRSYRQEPVNFGPIGRRTPHLFGGWYECGVPIPGKW